MAQVMEAPPQGSRTSSDGSLKQSDVLLAVVMAVILGVMIVPLPEMMLDLLIIVNISAALIGAADRDVHHPAAPVLVVPIAAAGADPVPARP